MCNFGTIWKWNSQIIIIFRDDADDDDDDDVVTIISFDSILQYLNNTNNDMVFY